MNSSFNQILRHLAQQLQAICENGREIDLAQSAAVIHKIGITHFEQSPDKISLVKSVGLLNAAIARKPRSSFQNDLCKVCRHIVEQANATNKAADLIAHANRVKLQMQAIREETSSALEVLKNVEEFEKAINVDLHHRQLYKIQSIKNTQLLITAKYKNVMNYLCGYCVGVLGPPPCGFAVVGMGSLARQEVTPYSDFEHIILLEVQENYESHLEYFRWFSVIFHTVILNLQETIIPSLNVMYLNDKDCDLGDWFFDTQTSGVSFDGMMPHACKFPMGKTQPTEKKPWTTELIKPVDKMLEYLSSEVSLKNGYHLSDILTKTSFVYGDQTIHDQFEEGVQRRENSKTCIEILDEVKQQVQKDLDKFATRIKLASLKPGTSLNVKQMFYRTSTLFITALGKMCGAKSSSCFDIINEVAQQTLSDNAKHKLSFAVAIACEIRLRIYMKEKSQRDVLQSWENSATVFDEILKIIDIDSIISYFQITYCLQREIIKLLRIKPTHIYRTAELMNITICYALGHDELLVLLTKRFNSLVSDDDLECQLEIFSEDDVHRKQKKAEGGQVKLIYFDKWLLNMEEELTHANKFQSGEISDAIEIIAGELSELALSTNLLSLEDALEMWCRVREFHHSHVQRYECAATTDVEEKRDEISVWVDCLIADCLIELNRFDEALEHLSRSDVETYFEQDDFEMDSDETGDPGFWCFCTGKILHRVKKYKNAFNCLQISLGIALSLNDDLNEHRAIYLYSGIGSCSLKLGEYDEALIYLDIAVRIIESYGVVEDDSSVCIIFSFTLATTYHNLATCLKNLQQDEKALVYLYQALEFAKEAYESISDTNVFISLARNFGRDFARISGDLGKWLMEQNRFPEAVECLQRCLDLQIKLSEIEKIAITRTELLTCYMEIYQRARAEKHLKDAHESGRSSTCIVKINPR